MNQYHKLAIKRVCLYMIFVLAAIGAFAQDNKSKVNSTVTDYDGTPISNAVIYGNEGTLMVHSGQYGQFEVQVPQSSILRIEAEGYTSRLVSAGQLLSGSPVVLEKSPLLMGEGDQVNVPFGQLSRRQIVGAVDVINSNEVSQYDAEQSVYDAVAGRISGNSLINARGTGKAIVVIDGFPRASSDDGSSLSTFDLLSKLRMREVDQIVLLKDGLSRMLYGAQANQPVILITTKRGTPYKRTLDVYGERGIGKSRGEYPDYLDAANYMEYYNKALANDGLSALYDQTSIENTRAGIDLVHFPNQEYYTSEFLNDFSNFHRLDVETSGGNDRAQYYSLLRWNSNGNLYKMGEGANARNNEFSFRGNIDYKLNDVVKVRLDALAGYGANRQPNLNFWSAAGSLLPNAFPLLIPMGQVGDSALLASAKPYQNQYLFGGTDQYRNNVIAGFDRGGYSTYQSRTYEISIGMNLDLAKVTHGLSGQVYYSFDALSSYTLSYGNQYRVYDRGYVPSVIDGSDSLVIANYYDEDKKAQSQSLSDEATYRSNKIYGTLNYDRTFKEKHHVTAAGVAYWSNARELSVYNGIKNQHAGFRANYTYDDRFVAELSGVYLGSGKLAKGNRYHLSPGFGAGWVISEEGFMKDNRLINYLKLKASYANIKTDRGIGDYNYYRTLYGQKGTYSFNQLSGNNNNGRIFARVANLGLTFLDRNEFNVGAEAILADSRLSVEANYFISTLDGQVVQKESLSPAFRGVIPYENFAKDRDQGVDLKLGISNKKGDFRYDIGFNMTYVVPKILKRDEVYDPEAPCLYLTGQPTDAIVGYVADGLFSEGNVTSQFGLELNPGDIKYKDLNNDGQIDFKDQQVIGNSRARLNYGVEVKLNYKNWSLYAVGTGTSGRDRIFSNSYYMIDDNQVKYSVVAQDYWTPDNASTATYPRLSTGANSSNNNNFKTSSYWIEKVDVFNIHRLQLTYSLNVDQSWFKGLDIYLRGSDLATFSRLKEKLLLNPGGSPSMSSFAIGCDLKF